MSVELTKPAFDDVWAFRHYLLTLGYEVLPIHNEEKVPRIKRWTEGPITEERLDGWRQSIRNHDNTGCRTGRLVAFDIDESDEQLAAEIAEVIERTCGLSMFHRIGSNPAGAFLYRNENPIRKICIRSRYQAEDEKEHTVLDVLGAGQQIVTHGIHPGTGQPYTWPWFDIVDCPLDRLPEVTPMLIRRAVDCVIAHLEKRGLHNPRIAQGHGLSDRVPTAGCGRDDLTPVTRRMFLDMIWTDGVGHDCNIDEWIAWLCVFKYTPIVDDHGVDDEDFDRFSAFVEWSADGDHGKFEGSHDCLKHWNSKSEHDARRDGATVAKLVKAAKECGYAGPTYYSHAMAKPSLIAEAARLGVLKMSRGTGSGRSDNSPTEKEKPTSAQERTIKTVFDDQDPEIGLDGLSYFFDPEDPPAMGIGKAPSDDDIDMTDADPDEREAWEREKAARKAQAEREHPGRRSAQYPEDEEPENRNADVLINLLMSQAHEASAIDERSVGHLEPLCGSLIYREFLSMTTGAGGSAKSSANMVRAVAMAANQELTGEKLPAGRPLRVFYLNLEDPKVLLDQRFAAIKKHFGITEPISLTYASGLDINPRFCLARSTREGVEVDAALEEALVKMWGPYDAVFLDPFIKIARVNENSNDETDVVMTSLASIATRSKAGLHIVDHMGQAAAKSRDTDATASRGGTAKPFACRTVETFHNATDAEVRNLVKRCGPMMRNRLATDNIEPWRIKWVQIGKANLSPPVAARPWFGLRTVQLENATEDHPASEVGVPVPIDVPAGLVEDAEVLLETIARKVREDGECSIGLNAAADFLASRGTAKKSTVYDRLQKHLGTKVSHLEGIGEVQLVRKTENNRKVSIIDFVFDEGDTGDDVPG